MLLILCHVFYCLLKFISKLTTLKLIAQCLVINGYRSFLRTVSQHYIPSAWRPTLLWAWASLGVIGPPITRQ